VDRAVVVTGWGTVLLASAVVFGLKLAGHLAPARWLERQDVARYAALLTVGLLAALVAVQTVGRSDGEGTRIALGARLPALLVAAVLLWRRAPFVVVVVVGALTAAVLRAIW
jgi:branched-subunit amino acid transport protein